MTVGTLVHSEIWNNLEKFEFEGQIKMRAFRVVVAVDEIFRDFAIKAQDKKNKRGAKADGLQGIRNQLESVESGKRQGEVSAIKNPQAKKTPANR